jgi:hypothetical protein
VKAVSALTRLVVSDTGQMHEPHMTTLTIQARGIAIAWIDEGAAIPQQARRSQKNEEEA